MGFPARFVFREQQSVATPQAARGWTHPPYRHFKIQSCFSLGCLQGGGFSKQPCCTPLTARITSLAPRRFAILYSAAYPLPFDAMLRELQAGGRSLPTLHVLGRKDTINPPELGERLASCFAAARVGPRL